MSLFAHYPARSADVLGHSSLLLSGSRGLDGLASTVSGRIRLAAAQTDGEVEPPVSLLHRPATADADILSVAGVVAGGALGLFAGAINTYNDGVDELNRIYDEAKAADFHADPVADDATGDDGKQLTENQKQDVLDDRVAGKRSALVASLRIREGFLMFDLDGAANGTAGLLGAGPGSPAWQVPLAFFGTGDGDDDEDDGGGGFFGDVGGALSDVKNSVTDGVDTVGDFATGATEEVWDRGSTLAEYGWDTTVRRATNPLQTAFDFVTLTAPAEDIAAVEGIVVEDGELYHGGPYDGEGAYLTGVSVPPGSDAITIGHTVRIGDEATPDPSLIEHETQHVYDIEDIGGLGFYGDYLAQYLGNLIDGDSQDEAYRNISWERRAYDVGGDPNKLPEGIGGPVSDAIDWVDGFFH